MSDRDANAIPRKTWEMIDDLQTTVRVLANSSDEPTEGERKQYRELADEAGEFLVQVEVSDD